jgi:hypothetical protein
LAGAEPPGGGTPLECGCFDALQLEVPRRLFIFKLSVSFTPVAGIAAAVLPISEVLPFDRVNLFVLLTAGDMRPDAQPVVLPSGIAFTSIPVILLVEAPLIFTLPAAEGGFEASIVNPGGSVLNTFDTAPLGDNMK